MSVRIPLFSCSEGKPCLKELRVRLDAVVELLPAIYGNEWTSACVGFSKENLALL
ncbi:hypothetical protein F2Q69_00028152 [Brassica cretica]|uniref:Uncharacterized protein n=1 Tax=Brassica cretica TaxID=69181 RepID=A0A8S9S0G0_BRACR|nr:hypothetical protein F2Q69_00028152 [Brassica cretica]